MLKIPQNTKSSNVLKFSFTETLKRFLRPTIWILNDVAITKPNAL